MSRGLCVYLNQSVIGHVQVLVQHQKGIEQGMTSKLLYNQCARVWMSFLVVLVFVSPVFHFKSDTKRIFFFFEIFHLCTIKIMTFLNFKLLPVFVLFWNISPPRPSYWQFSDHVRTSCTRQCSTGGTRPGEMQKKPKGLSVREREESGGGEGGHPLMMILLNYESIKRELKTRPINECRCDERLRMMHLLPDLLFQKKIKQKFSRTTWKKDEKKNFAI